MRFPFLDAAKCVADKEGGFSLWKIVEMSHSFEVVFHAALSEGKTYEEAMTEVRAPIR